MATVDWAIKKKEQKQDGTWNVKIRVTHKGKVKYIATQHFVSKGQLTRSLDLKDPYILSLLDMKLSEYRREISGLGDRLDTMNVHDLAMWLMPEKKETFIDIIGFGRYYIEKLRKNGRDKSADNIRIVVNSLVDFFGTGEVNVMDINGKMLDRFDAYLRRDRALKRQGRGGGKVEIKRKGLGDAGVYGYMRDLRVLFNAARDHYNDEDTGTILIPHYPFKKYKVGTPPETAKRNLSIVDIKAIRDLDLPENRAKLARDLFMLSFYLCGMNAKDMYMQGAYRGGRVEYNRSKTKGKRKDRAFISIAMPPEAEPLAREYFGTLQKRYATPDGLNRALREGFKIIAALLPDLAGKLPTGLSMYYARHSFATIARNICGFSKDDVALAMNHRDLSNTVTDIYIAKDWSIVDRVQSAVVGLLK